MITAAQIKQISGNANAKHAEALADVVNEYEPHVQAHMLAQVLHETGGLVYDREIWGPTEAQKKYEGRTDLGNTQKGDGSKFRGYGLIQCTGRKNTTAFYKWCKARGMNPPDFTKHPELMATDPWAALTVQWYWEVGNPTRKSLTKYADTNDIEMITRRVNGGLNGYEDRLRYYDRSALVLLGYAPTNVKGFQKAKGLMADGISGPRTRAAMHSALLGKTQGASARETTAAAPVVETVTQTETVAVTSPAAKAPWWKSKEVIAPLVGGTGLASVSGAASDFGSIPTINLIVLIVAAFVGVAIVLYVLKKKDTKIVQAQAAAIQGTTTNVG